MRGTIRMATCVLALGTAALAGPAARPALAHERLLHCATSPASASPGHSVPHFAQRRYYAPVRSAMYFSRPGMLCRWKAPTRRHG
ncbi:hypothetical protein [Lichenicoccus sp.]|uniref:hypothetical protein n=1 Tax=Lichenicoccus sp. TaxID=2781899 RepID=UPI003D0B39B0